MLRSAASAILATAFLTLVLGAAVTSPAGPSLEDPSLAASTHAPDDDGDPTPIDQAELYRELYEPIGHAVAETWAVVEPLLTEETPDVSTSVARLRRLAMDALDTVLCDARRGDLGSPAVAAIDCPASSDGPGDGTGEADGGTSSRIAPASDGTPIPPRHRGTRPHIEPGQTGDATASGRRVADPSPGDPLLQALLVLAFGLTVPALLLYRRLTQRSVRDNPVRRQVLRTVQERPGLTAADIARTVGIDYTTARYHLRILGEFDLVATREVGGQTHYLENGGRFGALDARIAALLSSGQRRRIVRLLAAEDALPSGAVAERLDVDASTASYHLGKLVEVGLLERERVGMEVHYRLPAERHDMVGRVLESARPTEPTAP